MTVESLLADLSSRGVFVTLDGDSIELDFPAGALTDDDLVELRDHRPEVLSLLRARCRPHSNPDNYVDDSAKDRPGWTRTTCRLCGRFIGFRPSGASR